MAENPLNRAASPLPAEPPPTITPEFVELAIAMARIGELLSGPCRSLMESIKSGFRTATPSAAEPQKEE